MSDSSPASGSAADPSSDEADLAAFRYRAFLSYSHRDKAIAEWLHRWLEAYKVPKSLVGKPGRDGPVPRRLLPIFRDINELPASADLGGNLREALESSAILLVLCSPDSAASRWVGEEILSFKRLGRAGRILAVVVRTSGPEVMNCFPPALVHPIRDDGSLDESITLEPLAADLSKEGGGRGVAALKCVAGILGVPFDSLYEREKRRRRRQLIVALVAGVLAISLFGGLWSWQKRVVREESEAIVQRQKAAEFEERGRKLLLNRNALAAVEVLSNAHQITPESDTVTFMLAEARRRAQGNVGVLDHQIGAISRIEMAPDGHHLLVTSTDEGQCSVWNLQTRQIVKRFKRPDHTSFSHDGRWLVTCLEDRTVLHDLQEKTEKSLPTFSETCFVRQDTAILARGGAERAEPEMFRIVGLDGTVGSGFSFEQPGSFGGMVSGRDGNTTVLGWWKRPTTAKLPPSLDLGEPRILWIESESRKVLIDLPRHERSPLSLTREGDRLFYLRPDMHWEMRTPEKVIWDKVAPPQDFPEVSMSQGSRYVLLNEHGTIRVLDAESGKELWSDVFRGAVTDGFDRWLAYTSDDGTVSIREVNTGRKLTSFRDQIGAEKSYSGARDLCFTPDGTRLVTVGTGSKVGVWDWGKTVPEWQQLGDPKGKPIAQILGNGTAGEVLAQRVDGSIEVIDLATGKVRRLSVHEADAKGAWSVAIKPDGEQIMTGSWEPQDLVAASVYDFKSGKIIERLDDLAEGRSGGIIVQTPMLKQQITALASGSGWVTLNPNKGETTLWDYASRKKLVTFATGSPGWMLSGEPAQSKWVALTGDGKCLAVAHAGEVTKVFLLPSGQLRDTWAHPHPKLDLLALNHTGTLAMTSDLHGHLYLWHEGKPEPAAVLMDKECRINELLFIGANSDIAVAACTDGRVRCWTSEGEALKTFEEEKFNNAADFDLGAPFDPDADRYRRGFLSLACLARWNILAAVHDSGYLCFWDLNTGRQLVRASAPLSMQSRLTVSPDGNRLLLFGTDGALHIYDMCVGDMRD